MVGGQAEAGRFQACCSLDFIGLESCSLLGCFAGSSNSLPTFPGSLAHLENRIDCPGTSARNYHYSLRHNPGEPSYLVRGGSPNWTGPPRQWRVVLRLTPDVPPQSVLWEERPHVLWDIHVPIVHLLETWLVLAEFSNVVNHVFLNLCVYCGVLKSFSPSKWLHFAKLKLCCQYVISNIKWIK
jgi:hypothetical protein